MGEKKIKTEKKKRGGINQSTMAEKKKTEKKRRGGINQSMTAEKKKKSDESMKTVIKDETETDSVNLRRTIYLTLMSSCGFEEAGHKLLSLINGNEENEKEKEVCTMLLECCRQQGIYRPFYALIAQRLCTIKRKIYRENFDECLVHYYSIVHRLETNGIQNVAKFFAHLLAYDALPWRCLNYIRLTEEDTTSSSRIFIKFLFQELCLHLGLQHLNRRLTQDPSIFDDSIFPKDNPRNTRFAINFFTSIGLGGISENLRIHLKNSNSSAGFRKSSECQSPNKRMRRN